MSAHGSASWSRPFTTLVTALGALASCGNPFEAQQQLAYRVTAALVAACPPALRNDAAAQERCSEALTNLPELRETMTEPFLWGQQTRLQDFDLGAYHVTRFNPRVFRRMYFSLFTFSGGFTIEQRGERTVVHVPVEFRNGLDAGTYPYPFWHSHNKWRDYQLTQEVLLVFREGRLEGAFRSAVRLLSRPYEERQWDGQWSWDAGAQPQVTLFRTLFSPGNPHVDQLDRAYRSLENVMRPYACVTCHSPDNAGAAHQLTLLTYPNQALLARHMIVGQLRANLMPPSMNGQPAGIDDPTEREEAIAAAVEFERVAEMALAAERETPPSPAPSATNP